MLRRDASDDVVGFVVGGESDHAARPRTRGGTTTAGSTSSARAEARDWSRRGLGPPELGESPIGVRRRPPGDELALRRLGRRRRTPRRRAWAASAIVTAHIEAGWHLGPRRAVAGQIDAPRPEGIRAPVAQAGQASAEHLRPADDVRRVGRRRLRRLADLLGPLGAVALRPVVAELGPQRRVGRREAPARPAEQRLAQIGLRRRPGADLVGRRLLRRGALQEALLAGDVDGDLAPERVLVGAQVQREPALGLVVPHLHPCPPVEVFGVQQRRRWTAERRRPCLMLGEVRRQLVEPVVAGHHEALRLQGGRGGRHRVLVLLDVAEARNRDHEPLELQPAGVGVEVEHGEPARVTEPQAPAVPVARPGHRGEQTLVDLAGHAGGDGGVGPVGQHEAGRQPAGGSEAVELGHGHVDHQPQLAQHGRLVTEQGHALVEVGLHRLRPHVHRARDGLRQVVGRG